MTEAAVVAQGIKGGPVRAGHQGMMMANTAQMVSGRRYSQIASGRAATTGSGPPSVGAGAGSRGVAIAGPVAISIPGETAKKAASTGARAGAAAAEGDRTSTRLNYSH